MAWMSERARRCRDVTPDRLRGDASGRVSSVDSTLCVGNRIRAMTDPKDRGGTGDPDDGEGESGKTIGAHKAARTSEMRASVAEAAAQDPRIGQVFGRY